MTDSSRSLLVTARVPPAGGTAYTAPLWAAGVSRLLGWENTSQPEAPTSLIPCPDKPVRGRWDPGPWPTSRLRVQGLQDNRKENCQEMGCSPPPCPALLCDPGETPQEEVGVCLS